MNRAVVAFGRNDRPATRAYVAPAIACLNLVNQPPALKRSIGIDAAIYLKEVLDRIELPPWEEIPDAKTVAADRITTWTIPYTEITLAVPKAGALEPFLFTPETVKRLPEFYNKVQDLPYRSDTGGGALFKEISSSLGPLGSNQIVKALPEWTKKTIYGQALWQWIGLLLYCVLAGALFILLRRVLGAAFAFVDKSLSWNTAFYLGGLLTPIALILFAKIGLWVSVAGLHIINEYAYLPIAYIAMSLKYLGIIWLVSRFLARLSELIIAVGGRTWGHMDVQLIRLGSEIFIVTFVLLAVIYLGSRLSLPTYSLVTGLGIGGIAVALAGREALSNLIGTVMIILDRPFKIGDYIVLGPDERGYVAEVGFRSTRVLTRDDVLISIPNSTIANTKMVNESAPGALFRLRIKVGVAYGSELHQVERALLKVAAENPTVVANPAPRVRFRSFGDSALVFELLCWILSPAFKGKIMHELNWAVYEEFNKQNIIIPFPQRDVHMRMAANVKE